MVSRTVRAHGTWRNPVTGRYPWPARPAAMVRYGYVYERDGIVQVKALSSLDLEPRPLLLEDGWKVVGKVRVRLKEKTDG